MEKYIHDCQNENNCSVCQKDFDYEELEDAPRCHLCEGAGVVRKSADPTSDDWFEDVDCPDCSKINYE